MRLFNRGTTAIPMGRVFGHVRLVSPGERLDRIEKRQRAIVDMIEKLHDDACYPSNDTTNALFALRRLMEEVTP